jgi:hypothetical protein
MSYYEIMEDAFNMSLLGRGNLIVHSAVTVIQLTTWKLGLSVKP